MHVFVVIVLIIFDISTAFAGSWFVSDNTVSTGKIIINEKEVGGEHFSIKGSGVKQTIERKIENFSSLNSRGGFDIKYRQGPLSLVITADDNLVNKVVTEVVGHTLYISMEQSYSSRNPIIVTVSSPEIESMDINGTSNVALDAIATKQLKLKVMGAVDLYANGNASVLDLNIHGTSDVKMKSLDSDFVTVNLQGSGDVELTAHKELKAKVSGVGDILFFGKPTKISKQISGVGDIAAGE